MEASDRSPGRTPLGLGESRRQNNCKLLNILGSLLDLTAWHRSCTNYGQFNRYNEPGSIMVA